MEAENIILNQQQYTLNNNPWLGVFVKNMPYPTMLVDTNRTVVAANQKLCDFFKLPHKENEMCGLNTFEILKQLTGTFKNPANNEKRVLEIVGQKTTVLNDRIETTDGRIIFRDYSPFIINGVYLGHLWIFYDETDIVKLSEIINEQKQFYEDILNKVPSDIAVLSTELKYLFVNPEAIRNEAIRKWIIGKTDFEFCRERGLDISIAEKRTELLLSALNGKKELEWEEKIEKKQ